MAPGSPSGNGAIRPLNTAPAPVSDTGANLKNCPNHRNPCATRIRLHTLEDILLIAILAVI